MKKKITAVLGAAMLLLTATGCAGDSSSEAETTAAVTTTTTEATTTAPPAPIEVEHDSTWKKADPELGLKTLDLGWTTDEMITNSILQVGDRTRLANVMKKAKGGQGITIGVIGGSITQGTGASGSTENYAYYNMAWWFKTFPTAAAYFNTVNAGIGATGSYIGVHRAERDLLSKKPDIVVVEFSVNDTDPARDEKSYEALVSRILAQDNNPAVILLFTTQEDGTSLVDTHRKIGEKYNLPMISYKNAVLPQIQAGHFKWTDISPDNIHPNSNGHGIIGELLWSYYNSVYADLDNINTDDLTVEGLETEGFQYADAHIEDSNSLEVSGEPKGFAKAEINQNFPHNYATEEAGEITFTVTGSNIGVLYQRTIDGKSGQYDVYVDGELVKTLDGNFENGWGNYAEAAEVYTSWAAVPHEVTVKMTDGSKAPGFQLLGLLVS